MRTPRSSSSPTSASSVTCTRSCRSSASSSAHGAVERHAAVSARPSAYPPPWSTSEAIGPPTDPADERIEVGFLIVGAGPAGLAAAIRLGQLIEEDPATAERLGGGPGAGLEKGEGPGAHLLARGRGDPRALGPLFGHPQAHVGRPVF